jgi:S1-C subfamily serine protease
VKEYLSRRGIPFREVDVGRDPLAAAEMVRISGQRGVPVTVINGQPVVGFDRARLDQLLSQRRGPRLGAAVADAAAMAAKGRSSLTSGAYIGKVTLGGAAARAGLQPGDVIISLANQRIADAAALEKVLAMLRPGQAVPLTFVRGGELRNSIITL